MGAFLRVLFIYFECLLSSSVLDDNKLLTLPNGERLALTDNIRIMFEVQDLRYAWVWSLVLRVGSRMPKSFGFGSSFFPYLDCVCACGSGA